MSMVKSSEHPKKQPHNAWLPLTKVSPDRSAVVSPVQPLNVLSNANEFVSWVIELMSMLVRLVHPENAYANPAVYTSVAPSTVNVVAVLSGWYNPFTFALGAMYVGTPPDVMLFIAAGKFAKFCVAGSVPPLADTAVYASATRPCAAVIAVAMLIWAPL